MPNFVTNFSFYGLLKSHDLVLKPFDIIGIDIVCMMSTNMCCQIMDALCISTIHFISPSRLDSTLTLD
jgi:hypothetical protein